jgi:hypothetical protein
MIFKEPGNTCKKAGQGESAHKLVLTVKTQKSEFSVLRFLTPDLVSKS